MEYANIMQPEIPMIAIYKGWMNVESRSESLQFASHPARVGLADIRAKEQQFAFVDAAPNRGKTPDVQKLVKKHVMNHYLREKHTRSPKSSSISPSSSISRLPSDASVTGQSRLECPDTGKSSDCETSSLESRGSSTISKLLGYPTALCPTEYAIEMQSHSHALLSQYLTYASRRMYPKSLRLKSNPLSSPEWFKFAVTDAAMLHAMLYSGATYLALLEGKRESKDSVYHLGQTISIVNKRLQKSITRIDDSTVGALSCLALGGAITGSPEVWHIHMRGLKQIIRVRGSSYVGQTGQLLLAKLQRTDIAGAIDYLATPYLFFNRSPNDCGIWSQLPDVILRNISRGVAQVLSRCPVHPILISTMIYMAYLSKALLSAGLNSSILLDPIQLSKDSYWIEYGLLSFPTISPNASAEWEIDRACRLGALLYMKALLGEFPHSATGASIILKQLQESLQKITIVESVAPLVLWVSIIGAAFSKSEMRASFVQLLTCVTFVNPVTSFLDRDLEMSQFLSLQVLGISVEKLWIEVTDGVKTRVTLLQL